MIQQLQSDFIPEPSQNKNNHFNIWSICWLINCNSSGVRIISAAFAFWIACSGLRAPTKATVIPGCSIVQRITNCPRVAFFSSAKGCNFSKKAFVLLMLSLVVWFLIMAAKLQILLGRGREKAVNVYDISRIWNMSGRQSVSDVTAGAWEEECFRPSTKASYFGRIRFISTAKR